MAIPTSGQIAASAINAELGRTITSQISIDAAENGDYARINNFSANRPNSANPAAFSEWYGYDHLAGGGGDTFEQRLGSDPSNFDQACRNVGLGRIRRYRTEQQEWPPSQLLWTNIDATTFAPAGWYADEFSGVVKYWNGSSFTQERFCRI